MLKIYINVKMIIKISQKIHNTLFKNKSLVHNALTQIVKCIQILSEYFKNALFIKRNFLFFLNIKNKH